MSRQSESTLWSAEFYGKILEDLYQKHESRIESDPKFCWHMEPTTIALGGASRTFPHTLEFLMRNPNIGKNNTRFFQIKFLGVQSYVKFTDEYQYGTIAAQFPIDVAEQNTTMAAVDLRRGVIRTRTPLVARDKKEPSLAIAEYREIKKIDPTTGAEMQSQRVYSHLFKAMYYLMKAWDTEMAYRQTEGAVPRIMLVKNLKGKAPTPDIITITNEKITSIIQETTAVGKIIDPKIARFKIPTDSDSGKIKTDIYDFYTKTTVAGKDGQPEDKFESLTVEIPSDQGKPSTIVPVNSSNIHRVIASGVSISGTIDPSAWCISSMGQSIPVKCRSLIVKAYKRTEKITGPGKVFSPTSDSDALKSLLGIAATDDSNETANVAAAASDDIDFANELEGIVGDFA